MRINIYQIDSDKDINRVKFEGYEETLKYGGINPAIYKCVFHGDVDGDLEAVYCTFNHPDHPGTFQGHSLSLSDIIEVVDTETTPYGIVEYLSKDSDGNPYVDSRMFCDTQEEFDDEVWRCELNNEDIFEELIRKFSESYNEEAGAHFTSRDIIYLMTELLIAPEKEDIKANGCYKTAYDMTMGTSQMLGCLTERVKEINEDADLTCFGQEFNPETYAIAKADMLIKGGMEAPY